jgi:hypothetical protein
VDVVTTADVCPQLEMPMLTMVATGDPSAITVGAPV